MANKLYTNVIRLVLDADVTVQGHYEMVKESVEKTIMLVPVSSTSILCSKAYIFSRLKLAAEILEDDLQFPKLHILLTHALEDLRRKGPLKNCNTILGEAHHPTFKKDFKRTDGRQIEPQVS